MSVDLGSQFMKVAIVKVILTLKIYSGICLILIINYKNLHCNQV